MSNGTNGDNGDLAREFHRLSERVERLEALVRSVVMERRRVLLDEANTVEAALGIEPRTSELRKQSKQTGGRK